MKRFALSFPISLILALTACGGGGGGGGTSANTPVAPIPPPEVEQPTNGSSTATDSTTNNETQNPSDTVDKPVDSGGSAEPTPTDPTPAEPTPTDPTTETLSTPPSSLSDTITGHYAEFSQLYPDSYNVEDPTSVNPLYLSINPTGKTDDFRILNINGRTIDIQPFESDPDFNRFAGGDLVYLYRHELSTGDMLDMAVGKHLDYARYGVVHLSIKNPPPNDWYFSGYDYLFAQGKQTPLDAIPTSGTAGYVGHRVFKHNTEIYTEDSMEFSMIADFDNKTVSGDLDLDKYLYDRYGSASSFTAKINGNTFATENQIPSVHLSDRAHYSYFDEKGNFIDPPRRISEIDYIPAVEDVVVNGAFYGPNAEEVAGTFYSGWEAGAFGGKKVENGK
ncbi:transferrin-binding protein-like solute binding protein [Glaesserella sp.]|uniref:transferrin-binding protein-like solute binding protein n=1 Tax=Glaesserella sp. TaxID=2094731 RepID=UPI00359FD9E1